MWYNDVGGSNWERRAKMSSKVVMDERTRELVSKGMARFTNGLTIERMEELASNSDIPLSQEDVEFFETLGAMAEAEERHAAAEGLSNRNAR